jgi:glycine hydroxymethyltransferase
VAVRIDRLVEENRNIHERDCFNLNPATNVMNPKAEAVLSAGLGSRPSLGYPGDKYEMGLEAIEEIEVLAAELCAEIFATDYAEIRVSSGAMANLYSFMATCKPGDAIIVPPASIGGHVTHHNPGCAGLYGLDIHEAPVSADGYTIDVDGLRRLAQQVQPNLITIGGSLNLFPHPVEQIRDIADSCGARVLFDAAHQCGIIAGGSWPNPMTQGAHLMSMSTYKSLGGPAGGLIVTNDAEIAERLDNIAFPGMTANFDAAKSAALALTMLDWREFGKAYADTMTTVSNALARAMDERGIPVHAKESDFTRSHQFAIEAASFGGGQTASKKLRRAGFLACGIGLPINSVSGDLNGLRIGTPELVRWGVKLSDVEMLADLICRALTTNDPDNLAQEVAYRRSEFRALHFIRK